MEAVEDGIEFPNRKYGHKRIAVGSFEFEKASVHAFSPVIDSSDIPANTVTSGCVGKRHELRKSTTGDHVCPGSSFLLQVLTVE